MKKYFALLFSVIVMVSSCTHETVTKGTESHVYPIYENSYRAKTISGYNDIWGDYVINLNYNNGMLTTSPITSPTGTKIGSINASMSGSTVSYLVNELAPSLTPDEITALDEQLKTTHGEGNYSLADTIANSYSLSRTRLYVVNSVYADGRVYSSTMKYYRPATQVDGANYDFTYDNYYSITNVYEYDLEGRVAICRSTEVDYLDPNNELDVNRGIYKYELSYVNDRSIGSVTQYELHVGGGFEQTDEFAYQYANSSISSITSLNGKKSYSYSGSVVSMTDFDGTKVDYTTNSEGRVTRIDNKDGNYTNIEYEAGHGDVSQLTPFLGKVLSSPFVI